jgi:transcriptional regulator with XRE-family HTH domain
MFDYSKLRGRVKEKGYSQSQVADMIGIAPATYSQKINNKSVFTQDEISRIIKAVDIPMSDIGSYFFTPKV